MEIAIIWVMLAIIIYGLHLWIKLLSL